MATATLIEPTNLTNGQAGDAESIAGKTLAEFSARQAAIVTMRERFTGLTCATPADYEQTRLAIAELRTFRGDIEKRCKFLKADAQQWIKSVNAESDRLIEEAKAIEAPLKAMKDAVDEEKERKRAELAEAQRKRLEDAARVKVEAEAARVKAEQDARAEANRAEKERLAAEQVKIDAENARLAAEREKIEAELQAAQWKLEVARRDEERKQQAARDELARQQREFQEKVDAAEKVEREKKEAEEIAERQRQAAIVFEQMQKEKAEREAKEAEEKAKLEAEAAAKESARLEAIKPDVQKMHEFGDRVLIFFANNAPEVQSEDAKILMMAAQEWLGRIAAKLAAFGV